MLKVVLIIIVVHLTLRTTYGTTWTSKGEYPYRVFLRHTNFLIRWFSWSPCVARIEFGVFCGGSVINKRYVLTAAHCVENRRIKDVEVIVGINEIKEVKRGPKYRCEEFIVHENFESAKFNADIALIRVKQEIEAPSVMLASAAYEIDGFTPFVFTGWAKYERTKHLRAVSMLPRSDSVCRNVWAPVVDDGMMCLSGENGESFVEGDSGSPIVDNRGCQVGIAIFSDRFARSSVQIPNVMTRVSPYLNWIDENARYYPADIGTISKGVQSIVKLSLAPLSAEASTVR